MHLLYPLFLGAMVLALIPVVIHLLQLRKPRRVYFTNNIFIKNIDLLTARHQRVQNLLLLLLRVLFIVFTVLAFCQPFMDTKQDKAKFLGKGGSILVDNSFSMQIQSNNQNSLFTDAIKEASTFGKARGANEKITLLNSGIFPVSQTSFLNQLTNLELTSQGGLYKLKNYLNETNKSGQSLIVFSDFQIKEFNPKIFEGTSLSNEVALVPLKGKSAGNLYVDSVWVEDAFIRVRTNIALHVRVRNGGAKDVEQCPVKVYLNGNQAAAFQVSVGAGQIVSNVVQVQVGEIAQTLGRVVVDERPVTFDNIYNFTLKPVEKIRILEIGQVPLTQGAYANEPLFDYNFTPHQRINYGLLNQVNLVLVSEATVADAGLRAALQNVVKRGGTVVIVPSSSASSRASYKELFGALGLGGVQWEEKTETPDLREVAMPAVNDPFFRDVFGAQQKAASMPRVSPVLGWSRTGKDIMRLRGGESFLAQFESGAGQVFIFSAPFAKEYTDFTTHALFVPVMYRMAMSSYQNDQLPAYRLSQGVISLNVSEGTQATGAEAGRGSNANLRLVKDSLVFIPAQRIIGKEVRLELPAGMDTPGFYQVQRQGRVLTTLAFNHDKRESELAVYSAAMLRELISTKHPNVRVLEDRLDNSTVEALEEERRDTPLWPYFVGAALLFLLAEALLVRYGMGRTKAGAYRP